MKSKSRVSHIQRRWLTGGMAAMIAALAGLALLRLGFGDGLTRLSYDFPFFVRARLLRIISPTDEVRMVYVDDLTFKELSQPMTGFLDRSFYARLIGRLTAAGAKLIVFDVLFNGPSANPASDQQMADAIRKSGRVALAGNWNERGSDSPQDWEDPLYEPFLSGAAGWGNCNFFPDADDAVRHFFPNVENVSGTNVSWLPWKVAQLAGQKSLPEFLKNRWFNFPGPPLETLKEMSLSRVLLGDAAPDFFRDKIVFVGQHMTAASAGTMKDDYLTPYSNWGEPPAPGTDLHAIATLNFLHHDWLDRWPFLLEAMIVVMMAAAAGFCLVRLQPLWAAGAALAGMLAVALTAHLLVWNAHVWFPWMIVLVEIALALFFSIVVNSLQLYVERRLLEQSLAVHLSPAVAKRMIEDPALRQTGGVKQEISIVFTDIANFSRVSEMMHPDDLLNLLNRYFDSALKCIHESDGTIVDLIGDAIFAIWNAPTEQPDHRERACHAALTLHRQLIEFEASHRNLLLKTRVGLHTGTACVGNIGSAVRFDYTAIGEAINLASRLEGLNKYLGTDILATREIQRAVEGEMTTRLVGHFKFKGFGRAAEIHELIGPREEASGSRVWREQFADALQELRQRNFDRAAAGFQAVNQSRRGATADGGGGASLIEGDGPSQFYLQKIEEFRQKPPPKDWVGEIDLTEK